VDTAKRVEAFVLGCEQHATQPTSAEFEFNRVERDNSIMGLSGL
jgi:hypothetical protein